MDLVDGEVTWPDRTIHKGTYTYNTTKNTMIFDPY